MTRFSIIGGTIIDGTGTEPVTNGTLTIDDGKIVSVAPTEDPQVAPGVSVVDATTGLLIETATYWTRC